MSQPKNLKEHAKTTAQIKGIIPLLGQNEQKWVPLEWHEQDKTAYVQDAQAHINRLEKEIKRLKDQLEYQTLKEEYMIAHCNDCDCEWRICCEDL